MLSSGNDWFSTRAGLLACHREQFLRLNRLDAGITRVRVE